MLPLDKKTLKKELKLFLDDKDRGISIKNFCEIAGISDRLFMYIIKENKLPMTESVQRGLNRACLLYTSPSPRDGLLSRMPSSA